MRICGPVSPQRLLKDAGPDSTVFLTSGYFNLTRAYMRLVLGAGASYRILTASPEVNGFFGAKGVAGAIPAAYIHIARQFYNQVCQLGQQERVHLHEYHRPQWTFHAKGWSNRSSTVCGAWVLRRCKALLKKIRQMVLERLV